MKELRVDLGDRSYPIYIGPGLLDRDDLLASHISGSEVVIVTNKTIAPLYLQRLQNTLVRAQCSNSHVVELEDGEQYKNLDTLNLIFDRLLGERFSRKTTLIALGGGVVGDMTGFAAACYQRGVPFLQIPTTLLAQVDSSVGGKTAVNHAMGKNMIGAFYQPQAVLADTALLASLPPREFSAGLAEVIKYGLIDDAEFFAWLEQNIAGLLRHDDALLAAAIEKSCAAKARIVALDETEQGVRALLNLGHTFGHALETLTHYKGLLHGEAVAIGMVLAARFSALHCGLATAEVGRIEKLLRQSGLALNPPVKLAPEDIKSAMLLDKKTVAGSLRLIVMDAIGAARLIDSFDEAHLDETLATLG